VKRRQPWIAVAAISAVAVVVGVFVMVIATRMGTPVSSLFLVVAIVVTAVVIPLALWYPNLAIVLLIVADLTRLSDISSERIGVGIFQPLLLLAIASLALGFARGRLHLRWSPLYLLALILLAVQALSVVAAGGTDGGITALVDSSKDLVYLAVVLIWVSSSRSLRLATGVLVITMASLAAVSVVQEFAFGNSVGFFGLSNVETVQTGAVTLRHTGPGSDANFWARSLVVALPIALSWWAVAARNLATWLAGAAVVAIAVGLYLSQSRGGFIAATIAVLMWFVMAGRPYIRWLALAPVALVVLLLVPGLGSRLLTLTDPVEQGAIEPSLQGRLGAQQAGIGMFLENPVLGVGYGEFLPAVPEYQRKLGIQAEVLDAHNLPLEIAAESGAVGLMAWGFFVGFGLFVAVRAWVVSRQSESDDSRWVHLMAAGVISGLTAWLIASVFLHAADLRILYTVLAVAVGLDLWIREGASVATGGIEPHRSDVARVAPSLSAETRRRAPLIRRPAVLTSLILVSLVAGSWLLLSTAPHEWVAERHVVMATSEESDTRFAAYNYDLITRGIIGGTYAALLEDPEITQRAVADLGWDVEDLESIEVNTSYTPVSQVITVRVTGSDAAAVAAVAAGIVEHGTDLVDGLNEPFVVTPVASDSLHVQRGRITDLWRIGSILAVATAAALAIVWSPSFIRRRSAIAENSH
jgi:O-antigen ligase